MAQAMTRTAILLVLGMVAVTACAPMEPAPTPVAAPSRPPPPVSSRDDCGAQEHQSLVGQPRTRIPVPVQPSLQRVACTTCPVTQDYNPRRLNFFFDAQSGLIQQVNCG